MARAARLQVLAGAGQSVSAQLPPPNLGMQTSAAAPVGPLSPVVGAGVGASFGLLYALTQGDFERSEVATWAAPLAGAMGLPALVQASESPLTLLAAVALGIVGYRRAIGPLNKRLGGDIGSDELCRLGTALGVTLLAAYGAHG